MIEDELLVEFEEGKAFTSWVPSIMSGMQLCAGNLFAKKLWKTGKMLIELIQGPIASTIANKYSCRVAAIIGTLLAAVCLFISAFAQNVITLIATIGKNERKTYL